MKQKKFRGEPQHSVTVPTAERINQLEVKLDKILNALESKQGGTNEILNDYIRKQDAMELLDKRVTWMWEQEKKGTLVPYKIGRTTFYKVEDILNLIENSKQDSSCKA